MTTSKIGRHDLDENIVLPVDNLDKKVILNEGEILSDGSGAIDGIRLKKSTGGQSYDVYNNTDTFEERLFRLYEDSENISEDNNVLNFTLRLYPSKDGVDKSNLFLSRIKDGVSSVYSIYGEHNKPTPSDIGAFDKNFIRSGSFNDIKKSGAYYIANAVTDKPTSTGGVYIVNFPFEDGVTGAGIYIPNGSDKIYTISILNGTLKINNTFFLDGSTPMTGTKLDMYNGYARLYGDKSTTALMALTNALDTSDRRLLMIMNRSLQANDLYSLFYRVTTNGVNTDYQIYGEHNITKGTSSLVSGSSSLPNKSIYLMYQ